MTIGDRAKQIQEQLEEWAHKDIPTKTYYGLQLDLLMRQMSEVRAEAMAEQHRACAAAILRLENPCKEPFNKGTFDGAMQLAHQAVMNAKVEVGHGD